MRKVITFLGRRPQAALYSFKGQIYPGNVFAEALRQFVTFDQMLVCVTDEARSDAWPVLAGLNDPRIIEIPIPRGESTAEMWEIFDQIMSRVKVGDTVIFDITHGLRSLPFLVFLFAAYLKTACQVTIEAVYYGALELGDRSAQKPAPVIDLSEFVTMFDWLTATDLFVQTGDAHRLAELLAPAAGGSAIAMNASKSLNQVSEAAFLCQPFTLMKSVQFLEEDLNLAADELSQAAHPFGVLREQISTAFSHFGADYPANPRAALRAEFQMILWYYQKNQLIQAMSLAREWLIDAVTYRLGRPLNFSRGPRSEMTKAISELSRVGHAKNPKTPDIMFTVDNLNPPGRLIYDTWTERESLTDLWDALSKVRNVLDHSEHQANTLLLSDINAKVEKEIMPHLNALALFWSLTA